MKLDVINWKILQCLQKNARQSNTEIARKVGVTSPAVAAALTVASQLASSEQQQQFLWREKPTVILEEKT